MSKRLSSHNPESVLIVLCGQAGQGIQTVEYLLTRIFKLAGYNVFATKEYMSRIRGGMNSTSIRIGSGPVRAAVSTIDILVPLNKGALRHVEHNISARTVILADKEMIGEDIDQTKHKFVDVPFTGTAAEIGDKIYSNVVAVGAIAGIFGVELKMAGKYVEKFFSAKSADIVQKNLAALKKGFEFGVGIKKS
ncbi:MAG: 2-oxoacid:acceptor oxidoreductase subunit alpha, partial [Planctomycetaceae bacterium]